MHEKDWFDWILDAPGKVYACLLALGSIFLLLPKLFRVLMAFYYGAKFTLEIKEHIQSIRNELMQRLDNIDDGQLNLIEIRRHTLDADSTSIWFLTDEHGQTQWVNDTWSKVTGIATEEALGSGWELGIAPEDQARVINAWRMAVDHRRRHVDQFSLVHVVTGKRTKVQVIANPIRRPDGKVLNYFGSSRILDRAAPRADQLCAAKPHA